MPVDKYRTHLNKKRATSIKPDRVRAEELERLIKKAYVSFYLHPGKFLAHPVAGMRNLFMVPRLLKAQSS